MSKEYPLFPTLTEAGEIDAQVLINSFKKELIECANDAIGSLYVNISRYIESDAWTNMKDELMDGLTNYSNREGEHGDYDFKKIRQSMLKEYRDDIIKDLNQDMVEEIKELKEQIERIRKFNNYP